MLSTLRERRLFWPGLTTLAGVVLGLSLGIWQLQRLTWKTELIGTIEARGSATPLAPDAWPNLKCRTLEEVGLELSCDYMTVSLRGRWEHSGERHVFISVPRQSNGIGGPGYWVFTPLVLEPGPGEIYVNRGFVPHAAKDPSHRREGQQSGQVSITGLLRSAEPRGLFSAANDPAGNVWYLRNPAEFLGSGATGTGAVSRPAASQGPDAAHFYVDQTSPPPAGGLPLPLAGRIELPNRHLEYALTWFALTGTLLSVFIMYALKR